jgi:NhaA family Na+:H+ antiporter
MTASPPSLAPQLPPGTSPRAVAIARRLLHPIEAFLQVQASSGVVLLVAAAVALFLANSSFADGYHHLLEMKLGIHAGARMIEAPVHFWINDGLMTIFFFVVGLEIRREVHDGELANVRRAAVPIVAGLGGMIVPALIYLACAGAQAENRRGWGVPMATDIAFAIGVLTLLGRRAPPAVRVLLLAVAVIDDLGSILVIALFYSGSLRADGFLLAAAGVASIFALQRLGVRRVVAYVIPSVVVWLGALRCGIHPTIAGVIVGLLTPARSWLGPGGLIDAARGTAERVEEGLAGGQPGKIDAKDLAHEASELGRAQQEALSPAVRLELSLHPWVAFGIMPVFALANAGVTLPSGSSIAPSPLSLGVVLGLVIGKPLGIVSAYLVATRLIRAGSPRGIGLREITVLGIVGGIGFTMALFVAALAFPEGAKLEEAKLAILVASGIAIVIGLVAGRVLLSVPTEGGCAETPRDAERSDDL